MISVLVSVIKPDTGGADHQEDLSRHLRSMFALFVNTVFQQSQVCVLLTIVQALLHVSGFLGNVLLHYFTVACESNGADTRWCIAQLNLVVNLSRSQKAPAWVPTAWRKANKV